MASGVACPVAPEGRPIRRSPLRGSTACGGVPGPGVPLTLHPWLPSAAPPGLPSRGLTRVGCRQRQLFPPGYHTVVPPPPTIGRPEPPVTTDGLTAVLVLVAFVVLVFLIVRTDKGGG